MNHYYVNRVKHLFVVMILDHRAIKAEGTDEEAVFKSLEEQARSLTKWSAS